MSDYILLHSFRGAPTVQCRSGSVSSVLYLTSTPLCSVEVHVLLCILRARFCILRARFDLSVALLQGCPHCAVQKWNVLLCILRTICCTPSGVPPLCSAEVDRSSVSSVLSVALLQVRTICCTPSGAEVERSSVSSVLELMSI